MPDNKPPAKAPDEIKKIVELGRPEKRGQPGPQPVRPENRPQPKPPPSTVRTGPRKDG